MYIQIELTFFRNEEKTPGVVIDRLDTKLFYKKFKNEAGDNSPLYNHYSGRRTKDFYIALNFTGRMDENGKFIKDETIETTADPDQIHKSFNNFND